LKFSNFFKHQKAIIAIAAAKPAERESAVAPSVMTYLANPLADAVETVAVDEV